MKNIVDLFRKAKLVKTHADRNGAPNVKIRRFVAQDKMKDGTDFDALITVKESFENGNRIYSLELEEINKAAERWTVNDDGTLTPENEPSTAALPKSITDCPENYNTPAPVKSIFDIVRGNVFEMAGAGMTIRA